ncbi:Zinc finger protein 384 [Acipenser ruthenus]|uniref:Zinc finger protein 384 n=1 Tax=Acipenser ruthenus TaxID=7906 RepID=A0A662YLC0_ACIRT|nr:Zinc finger protein 384 [Acipenser ruthenus]
MVPADVSSTERRHKPGSFPWLLTNGIENAVFINKKDQFVPLDKAGSFAPPSAACHYPTAVLTMQGSAVTMETSRGGGKPQESGGHLHPPPTSQQNITVVPVPSTGIMTAAGLVITTPQGTIVSSSPPGSVAGQSFSVSGVTGHPSAATMIVSALHPSPDTPPPAGTSHKDYYVYIRTSKFQKHHSSDPYDLGNEDEETITAKDGSRSYRCRMCAVTFFSKSEMQLHSKTHTENKPHKCLHCSKTFANSSYLAQHIRIHSGAKPYTCSYCQKAYRQLSHLQQHTRIHTGDRPYKCAHPGCEKAFTQLSNLQSHRRQHNKDKPYKCHHCHRAYTDSASLEVHLSTHTVKHAKVYSCGMCNRAYTSETYLMKHMRKHNPDPSNPVQQNQSAQSSSSQQNQPHYTNQSEPIPGQCPFDLHQYKPVSSTELQYKPVQNQSDHQQHKDLCLTVSTSAIQVVEHLNS